MSTQTLYRWGAIATIVTAMLFVAAALGLIVVPDGGLANPIVPALFYIGLILVVPAYITLYLAQAGSAGKLGFAGFVMSVIGSIMYSGPAFVLLAGTSGVAAWHDVWGFAMGNVLPLGASIFLTGSTLLGAATMRARVFPRNAGLLMTIGSFLWLVTFYLPIPGMLSIASSLFAISLAWIGMRVFPRLRASVVQPAAG